MRQLNALVNRLRTNARHPGWPLDVGPLRVPAGVVRLRAVRMRDGAQWSRIRLADRAHLEPWEPSAEGDWTSRHTVAAW
ncbi:GCN5 family acetyltransferase, partial [Mycobacterium nebraskense]